MSRIWQCYVPGVTRKEFRKPKFCYLESQQKALLKFNKIYLKQKLSFTITIENIYTVKESLIYNTFYVQTVPQNIYQHKSFSSF